MSDNTITELRTHLFDTLQQLKDKDKPMDIERAKTIADVAQTIINSAKVEVEHMRIAGGKGSGFIPELASPGAPAGTKVITDQPGVRVTRHTLAG